MNDQQLKIRIKLNQIPQSLEDTYSDNVVKDNRFPFEKPPFDWRKITIAGLLFTFILGSIVYWWSAEKNESPITTSSSTDSDHPVNNNDGLLPNNPSESVNTTHDRNTVSDNATETVDILPANKPISSPTKPPSLPEDIIPSKKPAGIK